MYTGEVSSPARGDDIAAHEDSLSLCGASGRPPETQKGWLTTTDGGVGSFIQKILWETLWYLEVSSLLSWYWSYATKKAPTISSNETVEREEKGPMQKLQACMTAYGEILHQGPSWTKLIEVLDAGTESSLIGSKPSNHERLSS